MPGRQAEQVITCGTAVQHMWQHSDVSCSWLVELNTACRHLIKTISPVSATAIGSCNVVCKCCLANCRSCLCNCCRPCCRRFRSCCSCFAPRRLAICN